VKSAPGPPYLFGSFRLEPEANRLLRDGTTVLTGKAVETLAVLVRHRDRVVEKDELIRLVWPDAFVSDDSLTQSISMLRKALGDDSSQPQFIATIPRRGYRFIGTLDEGSPAAEPTAAEPPARPVAAPPAAPARTPARTLWRPILWTAVSAAVVLLVIARATDAPRAVPVRRAVTFNQTAPAGTTLTSGGALSGDGRHLAFVARHTGDGKTRLWVRTLESARARAVPGTEGAFRPFWSPDGEWIAFFADGRLKKVAVAGGPPQTVTAVGYRPSGGTWSSSGVILYSDRMSPIYSVPASGTGPAAAVTAFDAMRQEIAHYEPQFLPDGRHFLYFAESTDPEQRGTYVASLDGRPGTRVLDASSAPVTFAPPGHLVFVRDQVLMAQPFDMSRLQVSGTPSPLGSDLSSQSLTLSTAAGLLAFGGDATAQHLAWFDRSGRPLGALETSTNVHNPVLSPDQRQLVGDNEGVWLIDLERGAPTRIAEGTLPIWSADGTAVVFTSRRVHGAADLRVRPIMGRGDEEQLLVRSREMKLSGDWTRDGRHFVYVGSDPSTRLDLWVLSAGDPAPKPFLKTTFNEMHPRLSPDGAWVAYTSDEGGSWEVYVQAFPMGGAKRAISVGGGAEPQWTKGGRELVYLTTDGTMMSVEFSTGAQPQPAKPRALFQVPLNGDITRYRNHYVVTADGQRFLVDIADESTREPITVVVNWDALITP
jgi:DNA-binding winged helix-turn-helix (wHTH) protein/Tol biopolymer transport system component